jgi:hypothetical protein
VIVILCLLNEWRNLKTNNEKATYSTIICLKIFLSLIYVVVPISSVKEKKNLKTSSTNVECVFIGGYIPTIESVIYVNGTCFSTELQSEVAMCIDTVCDFGE